MELIDASQEVASGAGRVLLGGCGDPYGDASPRTAATMARASATRALATNMPTTYSQIMLIEPGSLYHQTMPASSSRPAIAFAWSRVNWPRWTVITPGSVG